METKEFEFRGFRMSGFLGLLLVLAIIGIMVLAGSNYVPYLSIFMPVFVIMLALSVIGFVQLEPNEARAMVFFGKYKGTFRQNGFWWVNPFLTKKRSHCVPVTSMPRQ